MRTQYGDGDANRLDQSMDKMLDVLASPGQRQMKERKLDLQKRESEHRHEMEKLSRDPKDKLDIEKLALERERLQSVERTAKLQADSAAQSSKLMLEVMKMALAKK